MDKSACVRIIDWSLHNSTAMYVLYCDVHIGVHIIQGTVLVDWNERLGSAARYWTDLECDRLNLENFLC